MRKGVKGSKTLLEIMKKSKIAGKLPESCRKVAGKLPELFTSFYHVMVVFCMIIVLHNSRMIIMYYHIMYYHIMYYHIMYL